MADIGGEEVREWLFWMFTEEFDRDTFPTLVEALSLLGDLRIVKPTLERLSMYRSPVFRSQLLNAICRLLGAENRFYRILSQDELGRATQIEGLLKESQRTLLSSKSFDEHVAAQIDKALLESRKHLEEGEYAQIAEGIRETNEILQGALPSGLSPLAQAAALAITILLEDREEGDPSEEELICATICLAQVTQSVSDSSNHEHHGEEKGSSEE